MTIKGCLIVNQLVKIKEHKRPQSNFILNFLLLAKKILYKKRVGRMKSQPRITRHLPFFSTSLSNNDHYKRSYDLKKHLLYEKTSSIGRYLTHAIRKRYFDRGIF